jgi:hypothetical protein
VKLSEIDPVFFEISYYVVPDHGGKKAYAILFRALQETGHVALARGYVRPGACGITVRPGKHGMLAHTMFYVDEVRSESECRTGVGAVGAKELERHPGRAGCRASFGPSSFRHAGIPASRDGASRRRPRRRNLRRRFGPFTGQNTVLVFKPQPILKLAAPFRSS